MLSSARDQGCGIQGCSPARLAAAAFMLLLVAHNHRTHRLSLSYFLRVCWTAAKCWRMGLGPVPRSSPVYRPSCLSSKAIPPFVLLPPTAGSASLSQMSTSQYSSQAVVSSVLLRHKEQRDGTQKGAFLFSSTTALGKPLAGKVSLALSLQFSWMDQAQLLYRDTATVCIKSLEKLAATLQKVSQVCAALFRAL